MYQKFFTHQFKTIAFAAVALATGLPFLVSGIAGAATMTLFQKEKTPIVMNLSTVEDLSFSGSAAVSNATKKAVAFSMNAVHSSGRILFKLSGAPGTSAGLKLYSTNGRLFYSQSSRINASGTMHITIPQAAPGIYIARFINEKHIISQRVLTY